MTMIKQIKLKVNNPSTHLHLRRNMNSKCLLGLLLSSTPGSSTSIRYLQIKFKQEYSLATDKKLKHANGFGL